MPKWTQLPKPTSPNPLKKQPTPNPPTPSLATRKNNAANPTSLQRQTQASSTPPQAQDPQFAGTTTAKHPKN